MGTLTIIIIVVIIGLAIVALLVWRDLRDEKDIDPDLTDELRKAGETKDNIK